jgi:tetratricopeptide (TPR) repeat protein
MWHFSGRCSVWPTKNYDEQESKPYGILCNECLSKAAPPIPNRKTTELQQPSSEDSIETTSSPQPSGSITPLHKLALAYHAQKRYEEAEHAYQEALATLIGTESPRIAEYAQLLNNLGHLFFEQKRYKEAEALYARSLAYTEESFGRNHPKVARRLANLGELYFAIGNDSEADDCFQRAVSIEEKQLGRRHPTTVSRLRAYAAMLRNLHRTEEAEAIESRAYFPRTGRDRRAIPDRRVRKARSVLYRLLMRDRRRMMNRRTGNIRRHA